MSDTGAGLKPLECIKNVLAELWLANCCLAHDSLGFPVLLRFCDASTLCVARSLDHRQTRDLLRLASAGLSFALAMEIEAPRQATIARG
jgi:hypothetical protein